MDSKPLYRVGAAGLDPRDWRLIEIVFKHSQYNKYEFQLVPEVTPESIDILIVNSVEPEGLKALSIMRSGARSVPVIAAVPRGAPSSAKHAISIDRLTLQLLPILNRVVDIELQGSLAPDTAAEAGGASAAEAGSSAAGASSPASQAAGASAAATPASSGSSPQRGAQAGPPSAPQLETAAAAASGQSSAVARSGMPGASSQTSSSVPAPGGSRESGHREPGHRESGGRDGSAESRAAVPGRLPSERNPSAAETAPTRTRGAERPAGGSNLVSFPLGNQVEALPMQRLRVLVVDDSPTVRQQLSIAFERMGMLCEAVSSAALALERLASVHFDLALVDVIMPEMDGYKLTREIKRNRRHRQLPVIILTSKSSPFDLARGALAGCDTYLTKPVPLKALEAAVVKQLRKSLAIDDLSALVRTSDQPGSGSAAAMAAAAAAARNAARS